MIPVINFPILSFDQMNPGLVRAQKLSDLLSSGFKNYGEMQQARYAPDMAKAGLQKALADIANTKATTGLTEQKSQWYGPEARSTIGLQGAQARHADTETQFMPLDYAIRASQVMNTGGRFGQAYQLQKALSSMPQSARDTWIANNQDAYNQMVSDLGNKALQGQTNIGANALASQLQKFFPGTDQQMAIQPQDYNKLAVAVNQSGGSAQMNPNVPVQEQQPSAQANISAALQQVQQPGIQPQQQGAAGFGSTPQQTEQLRDIGLYSANDKMLTNQQKQRRDSAITLESWFYNNAQDETAGRDKQAEYVRRINNAVQYAGVLGKGKKTADEWLNRHPDAIADLDWYDNTFSINASNQLRMMEKMGVGTDQQRDELNEMIKPIQNIRSNPQRAKTAINRYIGTVQDISDAVMNASEPVAKGVTRKMAGLKPQKGDYLDYKPAASKEGSSMIKIQAPDGKTWEIPKDKIDEAIKLGAKRIE